MGPTLGRIHSCRGPGSSRSIRGTSGDNAASAQIGPFERKRPNATNPAPAATRHAKRILPARVFGVVLGSEIMWNAKIIKAPFWSRWTGIDIGSPSQSERPKRTAA